MPVPVLNDGMGARQNTHETSTVQHHALGTRASLFGRVFYYAMQSAAATTINRGQLLTRQVVVANHARVAQTLGAATQAVGATVINVDVGATAVVRNEYAEGYLTFVDLTGEGFMYKIRENAVNAGSLPGQVILYDPIIVATIATTLGTLLRSEYFNPIATGTLGYAVGVACTNVVADAAVQTFFWVQTWGIASVLLGAANTLGASLIPSGATAGAVTVAAAAATDQIVGITPFAGTAADNTPVFLRISP